MALRAAWKILAPAHGRLNIVTDTYLDKSKILAFVKNVEERPEDFANNDDRNKEVIEDLKRAAESLLLEVHDRRTVVADLHNPLIVRFRTQEFPLLTIYHHLAYILSVTGSPKATTQADEYNYYVPYLTLFSRWSRVISIEAKHEPYVSSIGVFRDILPGETTPMDYPFLMCSTRPQKHPERPKIRHLMEKILDNAGFERPRGALTLEEEKQYGNYGSCAETWQWSLMKKLHLPNMTGIALIKSKKDIEVLDPVKIANRLIDPCDTCQQLAKDASCPDVMKNFGVENMKTTLRQFAGPPQQVD